MMKNNSKLFTKRTTVYLLLVLGILILPFMYSCSSKEVMTKRLFMQAKRANIEFPNKNGESGVLSEKVDYKHSDNHSAILGDTAKYSLDKVNALNAIEIIGKTNTTPERDGRVSIDFLVRVPKTLLSDNWRVTITPILLHNDSTIKLQDLVLKGQGFADKQKKDYADYAAYLKSIIGKEDYDSVFLDRDNIKKDMRKRQEFYWNMYHSQWKRLMAYKKWSLMMEERYAQFNVKQEGNRTNLYHKYMRDANEKSIRQVAMGYDTVGINQEYRRKFEKRSKLLPQYWLRRDMDENKIPKKYRGFYRTNLQPEDIKNDVLTEADSIQIAKHRYFFADIAENEMKDFRRSDKEKEMIPYPYEKNTRLDSIVSAGDDFLYYYKQDHPVTVGLKRLRLTLNGSIQAVDESGYTMPKADTLSYVVSSLAQLADTSLMVRKTKLFRNMFDRQIIYPKFGPNKTDFDITYSDNRYQVDTMMASYRVYTEQHGLQVDSIEMSATTALDGSYENNIKLADKRVSSFKNYMVNNSRIRNADNVLKAEHRGEDWNTLVSMIKKRDDIRNKDEILTMLASAVYPDDTEKEIKLKFKADYKIISDSIYPKLSKIELLYYITRPGMEVADSMQYEVRDGYSEGLQYLLDREYWKAIEILAKYPDYNAALCLACMGYNGKAYDLLVKLTPNDNTEYLMAILCSRLEKEDEAVEHLLKAIEMNPAKAYRAMLDSETAALVNKFSLHDDLERAKNPAYDNEEEEEASTMGDGTETATDVDADAATETQNTEATENETQNNE